MFQLSQERRRLLKELEARTGVYFNDEKLLNMALTHPTYVFEHRDVPHQHNQRLEFLGDAVLGMVVAEYLYKTHPKQPEGYLTKLRASLVCETALATYAKSHKIGGALLLGKGEEMSGGRERTSILADAYEAFVGAIYLDSGLVKAREFVIRDIKRFMSGKSSGGTEIIRPFFRNWSKNIMRLMSLTVFCRQQDRTTINDLWRGFLKGRMLADGKGKSKKKRNRKLPGWHLSSFPGNL